MLLQIQSYLALTDVRGAGALKLLLSVQQHSPNAAQKRRLVGASLVIWSFSVAVLLITGVILLVVVERILAVDKGILPQVRWALGLTVLSVAVSQLGSVPGCVLRGCNLDYTALGWRTMVSAFAAIAPLIAVMLGAGLPGIAGAGLVTSVAMSVLSSILVWWFVPWFGFAYPSWAELRTFTQTAGWSVVIAGGQLLLTSSDVLVIGLTLEPSMAGIYTVSGALVRFAESPLASLIASAGPGLAGLCERGERLRLAKVVVELHIISLLWLGAVGVPFLLLNESFVKLWVGHSYFGGRYLTSTLLCFCYCRCLYRVAASIMDGFMELRRKAFILSTFGSFGVVIAGLCASKAGPSGVATALAMAMMVTTVAFWYMLHRNIGMSISYLMTKMLRPAIFTAILLGLAIKNPISQSHWLSLLYSGVLASLVSLAVVWAALDTQSQAAVRSRIAHLLLKST